MFKRHLRTVVGALFLFAAAVASAHESTPPCSKTAASDSWFAFGELLFWKASEDGLQFVRYQRVTPTLTSVPQHEKTAHLDFDWNAGFRVGGGYRSRCNRLYTALTWTSYENRSDGRAFLDIPFAILSANFPEVDKISITTFDSEEHWKLKYNVVDWEVGAPFCVARNFIMTPFFGLRGVVIDQDLSGELSFFPSATPSVEQRYQSFASNDFKGGGIRAGLDIQSALWCGFSLYGKGSASLIYGKIDSNNEFDQTDPVFSELVLKTDKFRLRTNLEIAFGIQWSAPLCSNKQRLVIRGGYEFVYWYQINYFANFLDPHRSRPPNLGIQGFQLLARYEF